MGEKAIVAVVTGASSGIGKATAKRLSCERPHGVHVGMVLPGFIATEGFPATELRQKALTRWIVSSPEKVAEAIVETGLRGKAERYVPRPYALAGIARILAPGLVRRVLSGGSAASPTTSTAAESSE